MTDFDGSFPKGREAHGIRFGSSDGAWQGMYGLYGCTDAWPSEFVYCKQHTVAMMQLAVDTFLNISQTGQGIERTASPLMRHDATEEVSGCGCTDAWTYREEVRAC